MVVFPNCKINLGLDIIRKRVDGFHDLETIFYPVRLYDVLEIIPHSSTAGEEDIAITFSGIPIPGEKEANLCVKAYRMLKKDFPNIPAMALHLHKAIPAGAGLGGGSADASFALKMIDKMAGLTLTQEQILHYAGLLGSDCPFFVLNTASFASGKGEIIEPVTIDLGRYKLVLSNPGIHINTAHAFSQITPALPVRSVREIVQLPIGSWKDELKNDFEKPVFKQYPEIGKIKDEMYHAGALYASMSGSGSTVYGIFEKESEASLSFPPHYFMRRINL